MSTNKILVTGSEGYIGSILMPMLIDNGYEPTGLDICYFADGNLIDYERTQHKIIKKDLRDLTIEDIKDRGFDAVIHLAALSNDPLGMLDENLTLEINFESTIKLAKLAKKSGIKRFIYSSSCSLYGAGSGIQLTEKAVPNPQTSYGKSKILSEIGLSKLADDNFSPVYMRNATAYGISPRMRFDLVVNSLAGYAKVENKIKILGDGKPWRPLVHIKDISMAMITALKSDRDVIHNQSFNIGDNNENYQIRQIATVIKDNYYKDCEITIAKNDASDARDYNVCFDKMNNILGYKCKNLLSNSIIDIGKKYELANLDEKIFSNRLYTRLNQIKYLLDNKLINEQLKYI